MHMFCRRVMTALAMTLLLGSTVASAQSVNLAWDASSDASVTGYVVKWGTRTNTYTSSIDVGKVTSWTVSGLVPDQKYYFVVTSYNSAGTTSVPSNEVSNNAVIVQTYGSLRDGRPSIFWQNQTTGQLLTWHMNGANVVDTRAVNLSVADTHWKIVGTGDLNGDGHPDLLWRHDQQGWLTYWFLQNDTVIGTGYLSINQLADFTWQVKGLGDVDGDGFDDIVWEHNDGKVLVWRMRGATVVAPEWFSIPSVNSTSWQVVGVTDLNGDRRADLVWQNWSTGQLAAWLLNGSTVVGTALLSINQLADLNWRIQAVGDLDGSGVPRVIFRNQTDGTMVGWNLSTYTVTSSYWLNPAAVDNLNWKMVGGR